jgi:hypothetical protein
MSALQTLPLQLTDSDPLKPNMNDANIEKTHKIPGCIRLNFKI